MEMKFHKFSRTQKFLLHNKSSISLNGMIFILLFTNYLLYVLEYMKNPTKELL